MNITPEMLNFMAKVTPSSTQKAAPGGIGRRLPSKRTPKSEGQETATLMGIQKPERFG